MINPASHLPDTNILLQLQMHGPLVRFLFQGQAWRQVHRKYNFLHTSPTFQDLFLLQGLMQSQKKERKSAMETVKMSFGERGSLLFAVLNVLQLVGWTAIMIYDGALAADGVLHTGIWVWAIIIGALIVVWIFVGLTNLGKLNTVAMTALFILSLVLFKVIFFGTGSAAPVVDDGSLTFGAAVELAVAMPLSWLPLISDYTREAEKPFAATLVSVVVYSLVSIFMYMIAHTQIPVCKTPSAASAPS